MYNEAGEAQAEPAFDFVRDKLGFDEMFCE